MVSGHDARSYRYYCHFQILYEVMKFREIGKRSKDSDSFSLRILFTEKDIKMALRAVTEDCYFKEKLAYTKNEMRELLGGYICLTCKIKLSNTYMALVSDWAFHLSERLGLIFESSYEGENLWLINDTRLGIGKSGPQKTGERVLQ